MFEFAVFVLLGRRAQNRIAKHVLLLIRAKLLPFGLFSSVPVVPLFQNPSGEFVRDNSISNCFHYNRVFILIFIQGVVIAVFDTIEVVRSRLELVKVNLREALSGVEVSKVLMSNCDGAVRCLIVTNGFDFGLKLYNSVNHSSINRPNGCVSKS